MNRAFFIIIILFSNIIYSQKGIEKWDRTYKKESAEKIIQAEIDYALEIEKDTTEGHYYVAIKKIRFLAEFTGKERKVNLETLNSMKRVFKVKMGSFKVLDGLVSKEFEFNIGKSKIWMPI